ncbi:MAG: helicase C-terminal domain-containing protein [Nanoarchaeota archaeon]|nr:helicase C-terminal domain-containing protein [Nanoarchaeota archaeon]
MTWNLYEDKKFLKPICFSNGKTQQDIVEEVLESIKKGNKIIFIHGMCGTGKSAIALNLAKELGKTSIVVPGKNLQTQYKKDYEDKKYLKKNNKENLKISIITGRKNHKCKFLQDNDSFLPRIKKEINLNLNDIFAGKREEAQRKRELDASADNPELPCKIELKERNSQKIRGYLKQNNKINPNDFSSIKDVKRMSIAPVCPYWSPVYSDKYELKNLDNVKQRSYQGLNGLNFIYYKRKQGCGFYEQFDSYIDSDVIVFNSAKYKLETALNRKPATEIEIIDECDEFLDSLSNQRTLNIDRMQTALMTLLGSEEGDTKIIQELFDIIKYLKKNKRMNKIADSKEILPLKKTGVYDILKIFLKSNFFELVDDESYLVDILETSKIFKDFMNESYVTITKQENNFIFNIVTTNLAKKLKEFTDKNKLLVLMSGTLHSKEVLKNVFGLEDFEVIDAETEKQGTIDVVRNGIEFDCKYANFSRGKHTRREYLTALDKAVEKSIKPTLIHVSAFQDLPSDEEIINYSLNNLISRRELKEFQGEDKEGRLVQEFKEGKRKILFSTRDSRGIDFPGEECNSIVFTKYPNPNVQDPFWKILMQTKPEFYWMFYRDKAKRELQQKLYRGLRFKTDHLYVLSPDSRVLDFFTLESSI